MHEDRALQSYDEVSHVPQPNMSWCPDAMAVGMIMFLT
jgi:hypothetical protein